jgi:hypothetical protein
MHRFQAVLIQDLEGVKEGLEALMQDFEESMEYQAINDLGSMTQSYSWLPTGSAIDHMEQTDSVRTRVVT